MYVPIFLFWLFFDTVVALSLSFCCAPIQIVRATEFRLLSMYFVMFARYSLPFKFGCTVIIWRSVRVHYLRAAERKRKSSYAIEEKTKQRKTAHARHGTFQYKQTLVYVYWCFYAPFLVTLSTVFVCALDSGKAFCTHTYRRIPMILCIVVLIYFVEVRAQTTCNVLW